MGQYLWWRRYAPHEPCITTYFGNINEATFHLSSLVVHCSYLQKRHYQRTLLTHFCQWVSAQSQPHLFSKCAKGEVHWMTQVIILGSLANRIFFGLTIDLELALVFHSHHHYISREVNRSHLVKASGMRNSDGLWNDGLNFDTCKNNGQVRSPISMFSRPVSIVN